MGRLGTVGKLRKRIVIQSQTRTMDDTGGNTVTWGTFATVWAEIEPKSANQVLWSMSLQHRVTHKVTIRQLVGVDSSMRILYGSRIFQIHGFRNLEEFGRFMEIDAEEGQAS